MTTESSDTDTHLDGLNQRFLDALALRQKHDVDGAAEALRGILRIEPRLAEPRLELARILLDIGQADTAEEETREALRILEGGGQWTDDLPEPVLQSLAWDLLGECIRTQTDSDEMVFGDPAVWAARLGQARDAYRRAAELDPENAHAAWWVERFGDPRSGSSTSVGATASDARTASEDGDGDDPSDEGDPAEGLDDIFAFALDTDPS
jgi:tetratricopeptide (TPR) repeat protein